jgi:hypothetical protein
MTLWHFVVVDCHRNHTHYLFLSHLFGRLAVQFLHPLDLVQHYLEKDSPVARLMRLERIAEHEGEGHVKKEVIALTRIIVFHLLDDADRYIDR